MCGHCVLVNSLTCKAVQSVLHKKDFLGFIVVKLPSAGIELESRQYFNIVISYACVRSISYSSFLICILGVAFGRIALRRQRTTSRSHGGFGVAKPTQAQSAAQ